MNMRWLSQFLFIRLADLTLFLFFIFVLILQPYRKFVQYLRKNSPL
jgi:hypothetical protein